MPARGTRLRRRRASGSTASISWRRRRVPGSNTQAAAPAVRPAAGRPDRDGDGRPARGWGGGALYRQLRRRRVGAAVARQPDREGVDIAPRGPWPARPTSSPSCWSTRAPGSERCSGTAIRLDDDGRRRAAGGGHVRPPPVVDCHETAAARQAARLRARRRAFRPSSTSRRSGRASATCCSTSTRSSRPRSFPAALTGYEEPGRALEAMAREFGACVVCVTLGAEGSLARCGGREIRTPAFTVDCVDSTGAGDVFRGGFARRACGRPDGDIEDVLAYANAAAALNCRALGRAGRHSRGRPRSTSCSRPSRRCNFPGRRAGLRIEASVLLIGRGMNIDGPILVCGRCPGTPQRDIGT